MPPEDKVQTGPCKRKQDLEELEVGLSGVPRGATHGPRRGSVEHADHGSKH